MAFNRIVNLSVGQDGSGLLISQLHIDFRIEKTLSLAENFAEFTVYNAKETTRNEVLKKGANVIFSLGYEDETTSNVFIGNIDTSYSEHNGTEWITKIKAVTIRSKDAALEVIPISLSYGPNTVLSQPIKALAQAAGLVLSGADNVSSIKLPNGWVYAGTFMGAMRSIKSILDTHGVGIYIDNNEIVIYNIGTSSRYKVVILSYQGGLKSVRNISKSDEKKKRIEFKSLIIPQIRVNGVVSIKNTGKDEGSYIVDKVNMVGNNYGGQWEMTGEATA